MLKMWKSKMRWVSFERKYFDFCNCIIIYNILIIFIAYYIIYIKVNI